MSIHTLNILEWPGRVESFHTVSPASTGLPTLLVRCLLAQKEGHEASVSLPACQCIIHVSQILASLGGHLTEELAIWTVNQPSPRVCPRPASVVVESCRETKDYCTRGFICVLVMQARCWWMCQLEVTGADKVAIE